MPTINEYADKSGYYIRARPSDAGNITYQIKEGGYPVIDERDLTDGDEITWQTIQSLKAADFIYTEESGTLGTDDFAPDPSQLENTELSETEARDLFRRYKDDYELSRVTLKQIRSALGLPTFKEDVEPLCDTIREATEQKVDNRFPLRIIEDGADWDDFHDDVSVSMADSDEPGLVNLSLNIYTEIGDGEEIFFTSHCIHLCDKHGLERWHIQLDREPTWTDQQIVTLQRALLLIDVIDAFEQLSVDPGDPSQQLAPQVTCGPPDE